MPLLKEVKNYRYCGNCSYNCCCRCKIDNCYKCKKTPNFKNYPRCAWGNYDTHYVCFDCRIGWKFNHYRYNLIPYERKSGCYEAGKICRLCGEEGIDMGTNFRLPKKNDKAAWDLVQMVIFQTPKRLGEREDIFNRLYADANGITYNTLSNIFKNCNCIYDMTHLAFRGRKVRIWFPKHKREFNDFIEHLRSTILIEKLDHWDLLRDYVKIRAIIRYWRRVMLINKMKDKAAWEIQAWWYRTSMNKEGSYHHRRVMKEYNEI